MPWVYVGGKGFGKGFGKGYGKGYGKGKGGGGGGFSKPKPVPEDFQIDAHKRYSGVVSTYHKFRGFGFITPDNKDLPDDRIFVHWKSIKSVDRYPSLNKDMTVEFTLSVVMKADVRTLQAQNVTGIGGSAVALQDEADDKKQFVGSKAARFNGTLKFFNPSRGFGYVSIDPGQNMFGEEVPQEIRVESAEMNCGGGNPAHAEELRVAFGIWITRRGSYKGYNVTLPDGTFLPVLEPPVLAPVQV